MKNTTVNLQYHDKLVRKRGDTVYIYQSHLCSCARKPFDSESGFQGDTHRARSFCPLCKGDGVWFESTPIKLRAVVTSVNQERSLQQAGLAFPGDLMLVLPPLGRRSVVIKDYDMIIIPNRQWQAYRGEILYKGQDQTVHRIALMRSIVWLRNGSEVVRPVAGVDYSIASRLGRSIIWSDTDLVPPNGVAYTADYDAVFEWIAFTAPAMRIERNTDLGPKVILKKRHLLSPSNVSQPDASAPGPAIVPPLDVDGGTPVSTFKEWDGGEP